MSITVSDLTKTFDGQAAVQGVSFDVPQNALFCVVGPSGCGKSTLLRLIAGLETPDSGSIALGGVPMVGAGAMVSPEDRQVGVVFQSYALWPHLSVERNVSFPYEAQGVTTAEALKRANSHLETVSLGPLAKRRPEALSGGQRQRVALARCLAGNARTILMDEPLANLDPHLRSAMEAELRAFHDRSGVTTLYITHDQREAMALADIMAVMDRGRMLQIGTPQDIYDRPNGQSVARFVGRGTLIDTRVTKGHAMICGQDVPVEGAGDGLQTVFIRPRNIAIGGEGWPVTVDSTHYRGGYWEVTAHGDGLASAISLDLPQPVRPGEILPITFTGGWVLPSQS